MTTLPIDLPTEAIRDFCRRHCVRRLSLFGSVLRNDFTPDSDIDVLLEFEPGAGVGMIAFEGLELELGGIIGRKVDLNTPGSLSPYFAEEVLREAMPIHVEA